MITGQKSRADRPPAKKKEPKGFYQEGKEKAPRVQINKITPRFFYAHPDLHPSRPEVPHTHPNMSGVWLTCSLATIDGKKGGGAVMIKISWVAVFDPQCAAFVSAWLHKEPDAAIAREETQYANFLTIVKLWLALPNLPLFQG